MEARGIKHKISGRNPRRKSHKTNIRDSVDSKRRSRTRFDGMGGAGQEGPDMGGASYDQGSKKKDKKKVVDVDWEDDEKEKKK